MKTETENQLSSAWQTNLFELEKAQKQIELYQSQTQKTQQTLELILSAYENGTADIQEILTIQQQLIKYKMAVSTSFRKYMVTKSYLDYLNGKTQ